MLPSHRAHSSPRQVWKPALARCGTGLRRRASVLLAVLAAISLLLPSDGLAHGALRKANPGDGDHLSVAPAELRLTFTEAVELAVTRLSLAGPDGAVALAPLTLAPDSATVLVGEVRGPLVAGTYTVSWQVAGADGHPVRGQYAFLIAPGARGLAQSVVVGPPAPGQSPPPTVHHEAATFPRGPGFGAESPLYAAVRWLTFLGLLGVLGAVAFRLVLWRVRRQEPSFGPALVTPASRRAARLGLWMAVLVGLAALLRLYVQSYALHGAADVLNPALVGTLLSRTLWGWGWLLQAVGTTVALVGFALARRATRAHNVGVQDPAPAVRQTVPGREVREAYGSGAAVAPAMVLQDRSPGRLPEHNEPDSGFGVGWVLAALGAVALAFTPGMSGHAAAAPMLAPLPIVTDGLHVIGAGGWLGSLLVLLVVGIPVAMRLGDSGRGNEVAALVNAFSPTALFFAGTVVATGVFAAWLHLGAVSNLWQSSYGRTLLLKLAVLSVVFGTGAYNFLRVKPALGDEVGTHRLRRSAALELAVGVVVLAVTAVLVATSPPQNMEGVGQTATAATEIQP